MKPLKQGELDALCGLYAVLNALRVCSGGALASGKLRVLFKAMVKDMGAEMPRILCSGSTDDDVERYLRVAAHLAEHKYGLRFSFSYRRFRSHARLQTAAEEHLALPHRALIFSADYHLSVATAVQDNLWKLADSDGYKYLHALKGPTSRHKPLLRAMPELQVFLVEGLYDKPKLEADIS